MAMRELRADTALLTEVRDGREHIRWQAGSGPYGGPLRPAARDDLRAVAERADRLAWSATSATSPRCTASQAGDVRAYIGVPFTTADARAYVLCCLAHEVRPDLGDGGRALPARPRREPAASALT